MIKISSFIILSTSLFFALVSCKKEEEPTVVNATISISEPANNDTIAYNQEVHFEGTVSGNAEMHGYSVTFTNLTTNAILHSSTYPSHASSYNFHEHWVNNVTDTTQVKLKIDVEKDHDGNHEIIEITVVCLPQ
jgi:hypothetical protein